MLKTASAALAFLGLSFLPVLAAQPVELSGSDVPLYFAAGNLLERVDRLATGPSSRARYGAMVERVGYAADSAEAQIIEDAARQAARVLSRNAVITSGPEVSPEIFEQRQLDIHAEKIAGFAEIFAELVAGLDAIGSTEPLRAHLETTVANLTVGSTGDDLDKRFIGLVRDFGRQVDQHLAEHGVSERWAR